MTLWFAALLGLIQGLTEYIPVSSTAHLRVASALFGRGDDGAEFTAVLQLGTLIAVLAYYARDLIAMPGAMMRGWSTPEARLGWLIALGTVPIVVFGLLLRRYVEHELRSLYVVAGALVAVGIAMAIIDASAGQDNNRRLAGITVQDAVLIGLAQTLALVPGVSRSGATICMALLLGFARTDAARFSFLLSIPAVAGAGILESRAAFHTYPVSTIGVGVLVAGVTGYASIAWLIRWLGSHQLLGFAVYRIACGLALLAAMAAGFLRGT
jgi:undecaprenyl-diphosphatase